MLVASSWVVSTTEGARSMPASLIAPMSEASPMITRSARSESPARSSGSRSTTWTTTSRSFSARVTAAPILPPPITITGFSLGS